MYLSLFTFVIILNLTKFYLFIFYAVIYIQFSIQTILKNLLYCVIYLIGHLQYFPENTKREKNYEMVQIKIIAIYFKLLAKSSFILKHVFLFMR